ncbi:MAG: hypothetical protein EOR84_13175 [Mesorhizobium sp.]|uniref:hypothetical protein n=1 Tax=Mesorhizobium sp. TaxID=1871066 RepID=UPI000FE9B5C8|nr:hypothetical protein [Mesorhizobium sp.]RWM96543.1 MAG: hypothetical protein EOR84_13175 [Mesorhizobium sp.]
MKQHVLLNGLLSILMVAVPSALLALMLVRPWNGNLALRDFWLAFVAIHGPGLLVLGVFVSLYSLRPRTNLAWMIGFAGCVFLNVVLWGGMALTSPLPPPNAWEHYTDLTGVLAVAAIPSVAISAVAGTFFNRLQIRGQLK